MTPQLLHSEFPYMWGKFDFLFNQCSVPNFVAGGNRMINTVMEAAKGVPYCLPCHLPATVNSICRILHLYSTTFHHSNHNFERGQNSSLPMPSPSVFHRHMGKYGLRNPRLEFRKPTLGNLDHVIWNDIENSYSKKCTSNTINAT